MSASTKDPNRNYEEEDSHNNPSLLQAMFCLAEHRHVSDDGRSVVVNQLALDTVLRALADSVSRGDAPEGVRVAEGYKEIPTNAGDILGEKFLRTLFDPNSPIPFRSILNIVIQSCPDREGN